MPLNRYAAFLCLIGISSCQHQSTQPATIAKDAPCACPFISDKPTYTINQTPDSLTQYYLAIWKREFIRHNGIDEARFDATIHYVSGALLSNQEGVSLRVDYTYQLNWLSVPANEQFRVKYDPETTQSYAITVPRGVYLTESQILFRQPWDDVQPIYVGTKLAFASCEDACQTLKRKTGFSVLQPNSVSFYVPGNIPRIPGDPYLFSAGTVDSTANRCVSGQINLVTGETQATQGPCWIQ